jgi:hypothetical protein
VPVALSAQDFACLPQLSSLVVDPSRAALRRRVEVRVLVRLLRCLTYCGGRITLFLVRQPGAVRSAPTASCDQGCAAGGMLCGHFKRTVREELCVLAGRLASIVAADAKSYDWRVT